MGSHPLNLTVRFLLEIATLAASGYWGWNQFEGWQEITAAIGIPVSLAAVWGIFNVPNDPSRSGSAPVAVPGIIRLLIELSVLGLGIWAIFDLGYKTTGIVFASVTVLHYFISYDRVIWLFQQT